MANSRMNPDEWREQQAEWAAGRALLAERIEINKMKLAEETAARAQWEARQARRAARLHRILTLGLGRAA